MGNSSCVERITIFVSAARRMARIAASRFSASRPVNGSSSASASEGASRARSSECQPALHAAGIIAYLLFPHVAES